MDDAFQYVVDAEGINPEATYPYTSGLGVTGTCRYKKNNNDSTCASFVTVAPTEAALQIAVATHGPISIAIDASNLSFQNYKKGVYNEPRCRVAKVDHAGFYQSTSFSLSILI